MWIFQIQLYHSANTRNGRDHNNGRVDGDTVIVTLYIGKKYEISLATAYKGFSTPV